MNRISQIVCLSIVLVGVTWAGSPVDRLLTHIPDETALVIVVPSIEKLVAGINAFGQHIGVDDLSDLDARALLDNLELLDEVKGLNIGGPLLLALEPERNAPLLLCTVKDADTWKSAIEAKPAEEGLYRIPICCDYGFAGFDRDILLIAEDQETIQEALRASGKFARCFQSHSGKLLDTHQLVLHVHMAGWKPNIDATLTAIQTSMQVGIAMSGQHDEASIRYLNWLLGRCRDVLGQIEVLTAGVRIAAEGLMAESTVTFEPNGAVVDYLKKVRKTKEALLRELPDEDSIIVFGCEWELPPGTKTLGSIYFEGLLGEAEELKERLEDEAFQKAFQATKAMQEQISGYNVAFRAGPDGEGLIFDGRYFTKQPQSMLENMRCSYEIIPEFMSAFGAGASVEVMTRTEQIESVKANVIEMKFIVEDEQTRRMIEALYGKSLTSYTAPCKDGVVYTMGPAESARARLSKMLSGNGGKLTDNIRVISASKTLTNYPQVCVLLDLPKLFDFGVNWAKALGIPIPPIEFKQEPTALAVFNGYLEPRAIRVELFLPADPIKHLVETFSKFGDPADEEY